MTAPARLVRKLTELEFLVEEAVTLLNRIDVWADDSTTFPPALLDTIRGFTGRADVVEIIQALLLDAGPDGEADPSYPPHAHLFEGTSEKLRGEE